MSGFWGEYAVDSRDLETTLHETSRSLLEYFGLDKDTTSNSLLEYFGLDRDNNMYLLASAAVTLTAAAVCHMFYKILQKRQAGEFSSLRLIYNLVLKPANSFKYFHTTKPNPNPRVD